MNSKKRIFHFVVTLCFTIYCLFPLKTASATADSGSQTQSDLSKVVITGYELDNDETVAAEDGVSAMILTLHIKNMDKNKAVKNVLVTYTGEDNLLLPAEGSSNQEYINQIKAGKSIDLEIPVRISTESEKTSIAVNFNFEYVDVLAGAMKNSAIISIDIKQDYKLQVTELHLPYDVDSNEKGFINANLTNTGKKEIYNIKMLISGDVKETSLETTIGSLSCGDENEVQAYATFLNTDVNKLTISFQYEDSDGNVYTTKEQDYSIQMSDKLAEESSSQAIEQDTYTEVIGIFAIIVVILVIVLFGIQLWKQRR